VEQYINFSLLISDCHIVTAVYKYSIHRNSLVILHVSVANSISRIPAEQEAENRFQSDYPASNASAPAPRTPFADGESNFFV